MQNSKEDNLNRLEHPYIYACAIIGKVFRNRETLKLPECDIFFDKAGNEDARLACATLMRYMNVHDYYIHTVIPGIESIPDFITSGEAKRVYDSDFDKKIGEAFTMAEQLSSKMDFRAFTKRENLLSIINLNPKLEGEHPTNNEVIKFVINGEGNEFPDVELPNEWFCFPRGRKGFVRVVNNEVHVTPDFIELFPPLQYFLLRCAHHILKGRYSKQDSFIDVTLANILALVDCHQKKLDIPLIITLYEDYHLQIGAWKVGEIISPEKLKVVDSLWQKALDLGYTHIFDSEVDPAFSLENVCDVFEHTLLTTELSTQENSEALKDLYERLGTEDLLPQRNLMDLIFEHLCGKKFSALLEIEHELLSPKEETEKYVHGCAICQMPLADTDKESIRRGIGPDCWAYMQEVCKKANANYEMVFLPYKEGDDITVSRTDTGKKITNVARNVVKHSLSDYDWGYEGSGPAELALNCLMMFCDYTTAYNLHQSFKTKFVGCIPKQGGTIKYYDIQQFIADNTRDLFKQK